MKLCVGEEHAIKNMIDSCVGGAINEMVTQIEVSWPGVCEVSISYKRKDGAVNPRRLFISPQQWEPVL